MQHNKQYIVSQHTTRHVCNIHTDHHLLPIEEINEPPWRADKDVGARLHLPKLVPHTCAPIDDRGPVDGAIDKLPGLPINLHGQLSSGGDDEHLRTLVLSLACTLNPFIQHAGDDREKEGSLKPHTHTVMAAQTRHPS